MIVIDLSVPHQLKYIRAVDGWMRIFLGIGMYMVHAVHDPVRIGANIRRALCKKGGYKKEFFPKGRHSANSVCGITMVKKWLTKHGQIPLCNKKDDYFHTDMLGYAVKGSVLLSPTQTGGDS